jgi:hypothetical protein
MRKLTGIQGFFKRNSLKLPFNRPDCTIVVFLFTMYGTFTEIYHRVPYKQISLAVLLCMCVLVLAFLVINKEEPCGSHLSTLVRVSSIS